MNVIPSFSLLTVISSATNAHNFALTFNIQPQSPPPPSNTLYHTMGSEARQLHVLFFPFMAQGHMIPMVDIARLFSLHGLKSTILTTPFNASKISSKITRYQNSGLNINILTIPFPSEEVGLPKGCESVDSMTSPSPEKFFKALAMLQPKFEQVIQQMHPGCIVSDMFLPWTTDVANNHGIPRLIFHGTSLFSRCVYNSLNHYAPHESDGEIFDVPGLPDEMRMKKSQIPGHFRPNDKFRQFMDWVAETEVTSYGALVNSFYELEPAYADHYRKVLGRRAWHIGPVSLCNNNLMDKAERGKKAGIDEHYYYYINWLSSRDHNSVIYISFGSVTRFGSAQLMEIAEGLEASGVSFVWVVRTTNMEEEEKCLPEGFEERIQGKGLVIKDWAPQVLILDHLAIGGFVTHCGWNSILEGVSAGTPMITWPLFAEQFQNETLIIDVLKIGIKIGVEKWNDEPRELECVSVRKEKVEEVVNRLMKSEEGEEMRKRAKELKQMAKRAVEEGGSSYTDLSSLVQELHQPVVSRN